MEPMSGVNPNLYNSDQYIGKAMDFHCAGARRKTIFIASFDGGGGRAITSAKMAAEVEKYTGLRLSQTCKVLAGTSAGSILAAGSTFPDPAKPNDPPKTMIELTELFKTKTANIFPPMPYYRYATSLIWPYYNSTGLNNVVDNNFKELLLCDSPNDLYIPACEMSTMKPWLFSNTKIRTGGKLSITPEEFRKVRVGDVIKASCSAPTYLEPATMTFSSTDPKTNLLADKKYYFRDGGLVANNPSLCASTETFAKYGPSYNYSLVSFGTGQIPEESMIEPANNCGLLYWGVNFATVAMDMAAKITKMQLENLFVTEGEHQSLFTFQPKISPEDFTIDGSSKEHMERLEEDADACMEEHKEELRLLCEKLITEYYAEDRVQLQEF